MEVVSLTVSIHVDEAWATFGIGSFDVFENSSILLPLIGDTAEFGETSEPCIIRSSALITEMYSGSLETNLKVTQTFVHRVSVIFIIQICHF